MSYEKELKPVSFLLFGHAGYSNRGCEAIVRSTVSVIQRNISNNKISLASFHQKSDSNLKIDGVKKYISHVTPIRKYSPQWLKCIYYSSFKKDDIGPYEIMQRKVIEEASHSDVCMSIGGDNYCYGEPVQFYAMDRVIKKLGKKLILWGASIEPDSINDRMINDLKQFDALFIRESITYDELRRLKVNKNIYLYPDPAFVMDKEELPLPEGWIEGRMIGLNLSPLIMNYEKAEGVVFNSFSKLINRIIQQTDFNIALIPHVTAENNNDHDVLRKLYDKHKASGRLILLGTDYTAPQLKGFIARCRLFIGARTHATIAAYSTGVPTLVLGYSVKSRGIARDIFGTEQNYVLPVQNLTDPEQLTKGFDYILQNEQHIREHLKKVMPLNIRNAGEAVDKLKQVCFLKG